MTGEDYSLEPEETEEERIAREARELEERLAWEESERLRIEQERIDDEHFRRGQAEAKQASVSLLARNFYFSIKDEACTKRRPGLAHGEARRPRGAAAGDVPHY